MGRPPKDGYKIKLPILQVLNQHEKIVASKEFGLELHKGARSWRGGGGGKVNVNGLCQLITNSCLIVAARTGQPLIFVLKASDNSICRGSLFRCFS